MKNKGKKSLAFLLTTLLLVSMMSVTASASEAPDTGPEEKAIEMLENIGTPEEIIEAAREHNPTIAPYSANVVFVETADAYVEAVKNEKIDTIIVLNDINIQTEYNIEGTHKLNVVALQPTQIANKSFSVTYIHQKHVTFTNITMRLPSYAWIEINECTVEGLNIEAYHKAFSIRPTNTLSNIIDCNINGYGSDANSQGIWGHGYNISGSTISGFATGFVSPTTVDNCVIFGNKVGISGNSFTEVTDSEITNNDIGYEGMMKSIQNTKISENNLTGLKVRSYDARITSCEIMNNGSMDNTADGAGISIIPTSNMTYSGLAIEDCIIENNITSGNGGGIHISDCNESPGYPDPGTIYFANEIDIKDTVIRNNYAASGGGIYTNNFLSLDNVTIEENEAELDGGGVYAETFHLEAVTVDAADCRIERNTSGYNGGGLFVYAGTKLSLFHSNVSENAAENRGGGIFASSARDLTIDAASTIVNNTARFGPDTWPIL